MAPDIEIQKLQPKDLETVQYWVSGIPDPTVAWDYPEALLQACYAEDPDGFLAAVLLPSRELVGCIAAVDRGEKYTFIGLFLVRKDLRGQGIGTILWQKIQSKFTSRLVGLNAVENKVTFYQQKGLHVTDDHLIEYVGIPDMKFIQKHLQGPEKYTVIEDKHDTNLQEKIIEYDAKINLTPRRVYLQEYFKAESVFFLVVLENSKLVGYGCLILKNSKIMWIAPVYANNNEIAFHIMAKFFQMVQQYKKEVRMSVFGSNSDMQQFLKDSGLRSGFYTVRMYNNACPPLEKRCIYGITKNFSSLA